MSLIYFAADHIAPLSVDTQRSLLRFKALTAVFSNDFLKFLFMFKWKEKFFIITQWVR